MRTSTVSLLMVSMSIAMTLAACKKETGAPSSGSASKSGSGGTVQAAAESTAPTPATTPTSAAVTTPATSHAENGVDSELEAQGCKALEDMGDLFAANPADCDKLAADVRTFVAQNKDLLTRFAALDKTQTPEQKAAFNTRHKDAIEALENKLAVAMESCGDNEAVRAAIESVPH